MKKLIFNKNKDNNIIISWRNNMKKIQLIGIIIILMLISVIILISPYSPLNKITVNGESMKIPKGYAIKITTKVGTTISNKTNQLSIYPSEAKDLEAETAKYKAKYSEGFNITIQKMETNNKQEIFKTEAQNGTKVITKYYFRHNNKTIIVRSKNAVPETDKVVQKLFSSI